MYDNQYINNNSPNSIHYYEENLKQRRTEDRRKQQSLGFTRISMVGWICRRERTRRKGDVFKWD